jgi:polysaccharide pyruvyl transferase WcaK-like protein
LEIGVLGYIGSRNIGDYIQTKAVIDMIHPINHKVLDREGLNKFKGSKLKTIINGWFMENPKNWPPNNNISPLFISFHINPSAERDLLKPESLNYLKQHEPIGCRDTYTQNLLQKNGIKSYHSSCITTTFTRDKYLTNKTQPEGVIVIGAFDRLNPSIDFSSIYRLLLSLIKYPIHKLKYLLKKQSFENHLRNQNIVVKRYQQITKRKISSHNQGLKLANDMLKEIAKSEIIITSRIHAALPALAMGLKVIFINEGLSHKNHKTRIEDVNKFFMTVSLEEFFMTNLETIQKRTEHKVYFKKINETITKFMNE